MIYELRQPHREARTLGGHDQAASTVSRDIRGDDYGKLEATGRPRIGPLNQVMHLWSYSDLNERARCAVTRQRTGAGAASTFR